MRRIKNRKRYDPYGVVYSMSRVVAGQRYGFTVAVSHFEMTDRRRVAFRLRKARHQLADYIRNYT